MRLPCRSTRPRTSPATPAPCRPLPGVRRLCASAAPLSRVSSVPLADTAPILAVPCCEPLSPAAPMLRSLSRLWPGAAACSPRADSCCPRHDDAAMMFAIRSTGTDIGRTPRTYLATRADARNPVNRLCTVWPRCERQTEMGVSLIVMNRGRDRAAAMRFTSSFPVALLGEAGLGNERSRSIHINARVFATDRLRLTHQRVIVASTSPKYYFIQVELRLWPA